MSAATVTITESYTSDSGGVFNNTFTTTISSVVDVINKERKVGTSLETILQVGSGLDVETLEYCRITNTDVTNFVTIGILCASVASYHKVEPGKSIVISNRQMDANATGGAFASFNNITSINADFDTAAGTLQVYAIGK